MRFRSAFQRLIASRHCRKQYIAIKTTSDKIKERVILITSNNSMDVSGRQWILCQDPFTFGIWFENSNINLSACELRITSEDKKSVYCKILLKHSMEIPVLNRKLVLFSSIDVQTYHMPRFRRNASLRHFMKKDSNELDFANSVNFPAAFSYPRKVVCVVFKETDFLNFFPMDFQGFIQGDGIQLLGLRNSNATLERILKVKKILVCEVDSKHKEQLYDWGKHHGAQTIAPEKLNSKQTSPIFGFPVPEIAASSREFEILGHKNLGSHTLMVCRMLSESIVKENIEPLHHLHCLQYSISKDHYQTV